MRVLLAAALFTAALYAKDVTVKLADGKGQPVGTAKISQSKSGVAIKLDVKGLTPGEHGMMGYRMDLGGHVVQMLRWGDEKGDLRSTYPPDLVQPCPPFMGTSVPVLSKAELESSAFTEAHLRGSRPMGWRSASSIAVQVGQLLRSGQKFIYAYYDGVDKIAHERGFGEYYNAELRNADRLVGDVAEQLVPNSVLLVTADHGLAEMRQRAGRVVPFGEFARERGAIVGGVQPIGRRGALGGIEAYTDKTEKRRAIAIGVVKRHRRML